MRSEWGVLIPAIVTATAGLVILVVDAMARKGRDTRPLLALLAAGAVILAGVFLLGDLARTLREPSGTGRIVLGGSAIRDAWGLFIQAVVWAALAMTLLTAETSIRRDGFPPGEFYALLLVGTSGMLLLAVSHDLMMIFLGVEILSVAVYALSALPRGSARAVEGGAKYFILGAFGSACLLYGMALAYGASGCVELSGIAAHPGPGSLALLGLGLMGVGLAFKIGAAPFHMWVPDAYTGASAVVTGFMASAVKVAAFGALARVLMTAYPDRAGDWGPLLAVMAGITLVVGNFAALGQTRLKRMLAYSSIAHTGFALLGLVAAAVSPVDGLSATAFYLFVYAAMTLGTFGVLAAAGRSGEDLETIEDCAGLSRRRPVLAAVLTVLLASMTGLPPAAGFFAKFQVFRVSLAQGQLGLVLVGILGALLSAYYYLRPVVAMYMRERPEEPEAASEAAREGEVAAANGSPWGAWVGIGVATGVILAVGLFPSSAMQLAARAAESLIGR